MSSPRSLVRKQRAIKVARHEAYRLAERFQQRAKRRKATDVDKLLAETAGIIIQYSDEAASLVDAKLAKSKLAEVERWGAEQERDLVTEYTLFSKSQKPAERALILKQLLQATLAELNTKSTEMSMWLAEHELRTWLQACDRLATLGSKAAPDLHTSDGHC